MAEIAICYATVEGQTERIACRMAGQFEARGHEPTVVNVDRLPEGFDPATFDDVIVAASVHFGDHAAVARSFVAEHLDALDAVPSVFVSVSLAAAESDAEGQATAEEYRETFLAETGWSPEYATSIAGSLRYPEYGLLKRLLMRFKLGREGKPTDTSREYEATDWTALNQFTESIADRVA
ncbi:flavodoxin domain-containing protein [Halococcoides cellulosivorans]|uniref:Protoporphyrinogen oxidase n=1 Tax=Halococcoides cellulosivorans TaxID=1679096 RepID=A0A2R4WZH0_9EURY|nr:flavodoxin domain-containing protein [Halococcoides cellulosivorans]AWB26915.1 protoporphyrinogen oxidase [Halococcoides cellulosivorans]